MYVCVYTCTGKLGCGTVNKHYPLYLFTNYERLCQVHTATVPGFLLHILAKHTTRALSTQPGLLHTTSDSGNVLPFLTGTHTYTQEHSTCYWQWPHLSMQTAQVRNPACTHVYLHTFVHYIHVGSFTIVNGRAGDTLH